MVGGRWPRLQRLMLAGNAGGDALMLDLATALRCVCATLFSSSH
jgi:hypothetical protein